MALRLSPSLLLRLQPRLFINMSKRKATSSPTTQRTKKPRLPPTDYARNQSRIATADAAAEVDDDPPFLQLVGALEAANKQVLPKRDGNCVVYWMRMEDLRSELADLRHTSKLMNLQYY